MSRRKASILRKILAPLLVVMTLQAGLIYGSLVFGGTVSQLKNNMFDIFAEKVSSRSSHLENDMIQRWSNLSESVENILAETDKTLIFHGKTIEDITYQDDLTDELLSNLSSHVLYLLRKNSVTRAFVILDCDGTDRKSGLYFRDSDPGSNPSDYSDLLAVRAPSLITKELEIAMDSFWYPSFELNRSEYSAFDFYYKPFEAAKENPSVAFSDLGYWSPPFYLNPDNQMDTIQLITYSVPLISEDGTPFGVLGVEVSVEYFRKFLPSTELNGGNKDGYLLAVGKQSQEKESQRDYVTAVRSGAYLTSFLSSDSSFSLEKSSSHKGVYELGNTGNNRVPMYAYVHPLQLYNTHTPFEQDQWTLIGVISRDSLLAFSDHFTQIIWISWILTTLLGLIGIFIVANIISRPIRNLVQKLKNSHSGGIITIEKVNISEIDELLSSIESLSQQVYDSASKLSKILDMTGISIGAFEYLESVPGQVFCTSGMSEILGLNSLKPQGGYISVGEFEEKMEQLTKEAVENYPNESSTVLLRTESNGVFRWLRLKYIRNGEHWLGVITDATQDILERKRIEHDRDYDLLTNLYNRRAFYSRTRELFLSPSQLKIAAILMMDLDNLKFINDTYGHDYGDEYIRSTSQVLKKYTTGSAVLSRLSGDEFVALLYGHESREGIRKACSNIQRGMRDTFIYLPDHTKMQIRASAGIAWYPEDSANCDDLIRYADFAMYMVKKTRKGEFTDFNIEDYNEESYLLQCREELNTIIEQELIDYQFQPIIDARTGKIYGLEALIRPQTVNIKTPMELLSLARSQSKLAQIERLTFFCSMRSFAAQPPENQKYKLFINSIGNQTLSPDDLDRFEQQYEPYLSRIVVELTEADQPNDKFMEMKQHFIQKWNAELALDDFGVGYNGEGALLNILPKYIKIDLSLIRNIDQDNDRQQLLRNLITYSRERDIKVIAEGVESKEEMRTLIAEGVDYLQGYYLSKPAYIPEPLTNQILSELREANKLRKL
jgi:diguanylate cyclase (GGDEF)-like protein